MSQIYSTVLSSLCRRRGQCEATTPNNDDRLVFRHSRSPFPHTGSWKGIVLWAVSTTFLIISALMIVVVISPPRCIYVASPPSPSPPPFITDSSSSSSSLCSPTFLSEMFVVITPSSTADSNDISITTNTQTNNDTTPCIHGPLLLPTITNINGGIVPASAVADTASRIISSLSSFLPSFPSLSSATTSSLPSSATTSSPFIRFAAAASVNSSSRSQYADDLVITIGYLRMAGVDDSSLLAGLLATVDDANHNEFGNGMLFKVSVTSVACANYTDCVAYLASSNATAPDGPIQRFLDAMSGFSAIFRPNLLISGQIIDHAKALGSIPVIDPASSRAQDFTALLETGDGGLASADHVIHFQQYVKSEVVHLFTYMQYTDGCAMTGIFYEEFADIEKHLAGVTAMYTDGGSDAPPTLLLDNGTAQDEIFAFLANDTNRQCYLLLVSHGTAMNLAAILASPRFRQGTSDGALPKKVHFYGVSITAGTSYNIPHTPENRDFVMNHMTAETNPLSHFHYVRWAPPYVTKPAGYTSTTKGQPFLTACEDIRAIYARWQAGVYNDPDSRAAIAKDTNGNTSDDVFITLTASGMGYEGTAISVLLAEKSVINDPATYNYLTNISMTVALSDLNPFVEGVDLIPAVPDNSMLEGYLLGMFLLDSIRLAATSNATAVQSTAAVPVPWGSITAAFYDYPQTIGNYAFERMRRTCPPKPIAQNCYCNTAAVTSYVYRVNTSARNGRPYAVFDDESVGQRDIASFEYVGKCELSITSRNYPIVAIGFQVTSDFVPSSTDSNSFANSIAISERINRQEMISTSILSRVVKSNLATPEPARPFRHYSWMLSSGETTEGAMAEAVAKYAPFVIIGSTEGTIKHPPILTLLPMLLEPQLEDPPLVPSAQWDYKIVNLIPALADYIHALAAFYSGHVQYYSAFHAIASTAEEAVLVSKSMATFGFDVPVSSIVVSGDEAVWRAQMGLWLTNNGQYDPASTTSTSTSSTSTATTGGSAPNSSSIDEPPLAIESAKPQPYILATSLLATDCMHAALEVAKTYTGHGRIALAVPARMLNTQHLTVDFRRSTAGGTNDVGVDVNDGSGDSAASGGGTTDNRIGDVFFASSIYDWWLPSKHEGLSDAEKLLADDPLYWYVQAASDITSQLAQRAQYDYSADAATLAYDIAAFSSGGSSYGPISNTRCTAAEIASNTRDRSCQCTKGPRTMFLMSLKSWQEGTASNMYTKDFRYTLGKCGVSYKPYVPPLVDNSISTGAIVGICVALVAFLVVFLVGGFIINLLFFGRNNRYAPADSSKPFTIVFTDIQASTALWARAPSAMSEAVEQHHAIMRKLIGRCRGYEVKTIGDSFMIAFKDPNDAVKFSVSTQIAFYEAAWNSEIDAVYTELLMEAEAAAEAAGGGAPHHRTGDEKQHNNHSSVGAGGKNDEINTVSTEQRQYAASPYQGFAGSTTNASTAAMLMGNQHNNNATTASVQPHSASASPTSSHHHFPLPGNAPPPVFLPATNALSSVNLLETLFAPEYSPTSGGATTIGTCNNNAATREQLTANDMLMGGSASNASGGAHSTSRAARSVTNAFTHHVNSPLATARGQQQQQQCIALATPLDASVNNNNNNNNYAFSPVPPTQQQQQQQGLLVGKDSSPSSPLGGAAAGSAGGGVNNAYSFDRSAAVAANNNNNSSSYNAHRRGSSRFVFEEGNTPTANNNGNNVSSYSIPASASFPLAPRAASPTRSNVGNGNGFVPVDKSTGGGAAKVVASTSTNNHFLNATADGGAGGVLPSVSGNSFSSSLTTTARNAKGKGSRGPWHGIRVRIGVNYGMGEARKDPVTHGYDYYGTVVNTAARVEGVGHGGQTLLTAALMDVIEPTTLQRLDTVVLSLGPQPLRGLDGPITLTQIVPRSLSARLFPPLRLDVEVDITEEENDTETGGTGTGTGGNGNSTAASSVNFVDLAAQLCSTRQYSGHVSVEELLFNLNVFNTIFGPTKPKWQHDTMARLGESWGFEKAAAAVKHDATRMRFLTNFMGKVTKAINLSGSNNGYSPTGNNAINNNATSRCRSANNNTGTNGTNSVRNLQSSRNGRPRGAAVGSSSHNNNATSSQQNPSAFMDAVEQLSQQPSSSTSPQHLQPPHHHHHQQGMTSRSLGGRSANNTNNSSSAAGGVSRMNNTTNNSNAHNNNNSSNNFHSYYANSSGPLANNNNNNNNNQYFGAATANFGPHYGGGGVGADSEPQSIIILSGGAAVAGDDSSSTIGGNGNSVAVGGLLPNPSSAVANPNTPAAFVASPQMSSASQHLSSSAAMSGGGGGGYGSQSSPMPGVVANQHHPHRFAALRINTNTHTAATHRPAAAVSSPTVTAGANNATAAVAAADDAVGVGGESPPPSMGTTDGTTTAGTARPHHQPSDGAASH